MVIFALSPHHHSVVVDAPRGRDPTSERDVTRHVQDGDGTFYELPVSTEGWLLGAEDVLWSACRLGQERVV